MNSSVYELFKFTKSKVTDQDIRDFSPNDPGYPDYVKKWTGIRYSGGIPRDADFDLAEVLNLTVFCNPIEYKDPERFQIYRRFTTSVALGLIHHGNDCEAVCPASYLVRNLVLDSEGESKKYVMLLRAAVDATRLFLSSENLDVGYPYFTFASMILSQKLRDWVGAEYYATLLIEDEKSVRSNEGMNWLVQDNRFLLGLTIYDSCHKDWLAFAKKLQNPNDHEDTQLVIEALKNS